MSSLNGGGSSFTITKPENEPPILAPPPKLSKFAHSDLRFISLCEYIGNGGIREKIVVLRRTKLMIVSVDGTVNHECNVGSIMRAFRQMNRGYTKETVVLHLANESKKYLCFRFPALREPEKPLGETLLSAVSYYRSENLPCVIEDHMGKDDIVKSIAGISPNPVSNFFKSKKSNAKKEKLDEVSAALKMQPPLPVVMNAGNDENTEKYRERINRLYAKHNPSKVGSPLIEEALLSFKGDEEELMKNLVKKYGPEPGPPTPPPPTAEEIAAEEQKRKEEGEATARAALAAAQPKSILQEDLEEYFQKHDPARPLSDAEALAKTYTDNEKDLWTKLFDQYGVTLLDPPKQPPGPINNISSYQFPSTASTEQQNNSAGGAPSSSHLFSNNNNTTAQPAPSTTTNPMLASDIGLLPSESIKDSGQSLLITATPPGARPPSPPGPAIPKALEQQQALISTTPDTHPVLQSVDNSHLLPAHQLGGGQNQQQQSPAVLGVAGNNGGTSLPQQQAGATTTSVVPGTNIMSPNVLLAPTGGPSSSFTPSSTTPQIPHAQGGGLDFPSSSISISPQAGGGSGGAGDSKSLSDSTNALGSTMNSTTSPGGLLLPPQSMTPLPTPQTPSVIVGDGLNNNTTHNASASSLSPPNNSTVTGGGGGYQIPSVHFDPMTGNQIPDRPSIQEEEVAAEIKGLLSELQGIDAEKLPKSDPEQYYLMNQQLKAQQQQSLLQQQFQTDAMKTMMETIISLKEEMHDLKTSSPSRENNSHSGGVLSVPEIEGDGGHNNSHINQHQLRQPESMDRRVLKQLLGGGGQEQQEVGGGGDLISIDHFPIGREDDSASESGDDEDDLQHLLEEGESGGKGRSSNEPKPGMVPWPIDSPLAPLGGGGAKMDAHQQKATDPTNFFGPTPKQIDVAFKALEEIRHVHSTISLGMGSGGGGSGSSGGGGADASTRASIEGLSGAMRTLYDTIAPHTTHLKGTLQAKEITKKHTAGVLASKLLPSWATVDFGEINMNVRPPATYLYHRLIALKEIQTADPLAPEEAESLGGTPLAVERCLWIANRGQFAAGEGGWLMPFSTIQNVVAGGVRLAARVKSQQPLLEKEKSIVTHDPTVDDVVEDGKTLTVYSNRSSVMIAFEKKAPRDAWLEELRRHIQQRNARLAQKKALLRIDQERKEREAREAALRAPDPTGHGGEHSPDPSRDLLDMIERGPQPSEGFDDRGPSL